MSETVVGLDALEPPEGGTAVAIGTFDGVHLGHRMLLASAVERAAASGASSVALTWDRHPAQTLRPDKTPPLLSSPARKIELLGDTGVDVVAVLAFDEAFAQMAPEAFVDEVLVRRLGAKAVVVGHDWRFGHRAAGDVGLLASMGAGRGFEVEGMELSEVAGEPVTSSRVRRVLAEADLDQARDLLGRRFDVDGIVREGAGRGKGLGYPTANLAIERDLLLPPRGVYAGRAWAGSQVYTAAINVGVNPTFGGEVGETPLSVEVYLLDFSGDLYGQTLRVEFWGKLRDERHFERVEDLVEAIDGDVARTRVLVEE